MHLISATHHPAAGIHIPSRSNISFSLRASSSVFFQPSRFMSTRPSADTRTSSSSRSILCRSGCSKDAAPVRYPWLLPRLKALAFALFHPFITTQLLYNISQVFFVLILLRNSGMLNRLKPITRESPQDKSPERRTASAGFLFIIAYSFAFGTARRQPVPFTSPVHNKHLAHACA